MRSRHSSSGFTMIEVMVAAGVLAFVGLVMFMGVRAVIRGISQADELQERSYVGRMALERMRKEISMAFLSLHNNVEEEPRSESLFIGERDRIVFLSFGHERRIRDAKEADQMVVEYYVDRSPDEERCKDKALLRRIKPYRDTRPEKDGRVQVIACGVNSVSFEYWNRNEQGGDWEREWEVQPEDLDELLIQSTMLTALSGKKELAEAEEEKDLDVQLPWRVKIRLELGYDDPNTGRDNPIILETQTSLYVRNPINFTYSGGLKAMPSKPGGATGVGRTSRPGGGARGGR
jgi:type II secretory pathway component PulJ